MNRLMLCAGSTKREGWITLDCNPLHHPDIQAAIPPLPPPVMERLWDEVEWIHGITSLYPWDAKLVLQQLHAAMRPGGKLVLEQPDARLVADAVIQTQGGCLEWFFGDPMMRDPAHMNKWAYTPWSLIDLLTEAGFKDSYIKTAEYHRPDRDFRIEAIA